VPLVYLIAPLLHVFIQRQHRREINCFIHTNTMRQPKTTITNTPYSKVIQKYVHESNKERKSHKQPIFNTVEAESLGYQPRSYNSQTDEDDNFSSTSSQQRQLHRRKETTQRILRLSLVILSAFFSKYIHNQWVSPYLLPQIQQSSRRFKELNRPSFVFDHPYITSSYYTTTKSIATLEQMERLQIDPKQDRPPDIERGIVSRLAIVRPFCEFDADSLPTTFACWNSLVPCRAAEQDLGEEENGEEVVDEWVVFDMSVNGTGRKLEEEDEENWECEADYSDSANSSSWFRGFASSLFKRCKPKTRKDYFDDVPADGLRTTSADLFLFYSQTFSENDVAIHAVDEIMNEYFSAGGWNRCFDNIYAIEANIPQELDLYIPAAQEELYNWVNGPNRQYEAAFRIIQSGEWGNYDAFYLMEGDSVPVKNYWLDVILGEINAYRPFAVLGA
jgi:hypothetical protein